MHLDDDIKGFVKGVFAGCGILCVIEIVVGFLISLTGLYSFDATFIIGAVGGTLVGMICFIWMAISLQRSLDNAQNGGAEVRRGVQKGYTLRMGLQLLWMVAAILVPFIHTIGGLVPLLFPKIAIYILRITGKLNLTQNVNSTAGVKGGES
jgi:hypothetical protein